MESSSSFWKYSWNRRSKCWSGVNAGSRGRVDQVLGGEHAFLVVDEPLNVLDEMVDQREQLGVFVRCIIAIARLMVFPDVEIVLQDVSIGNYADSVTIERFDHLEPGITHQDAHAVRCNPGDPGDVGTGRPIPDLEVRRVSTASLRLTKVSGVMGTPICSGRTG